MTSTPNSQEPEWDVPDDTDTYRLSDPVPRPSTPSPVPTPRKRKKRKPAAHADAEPTAEVGAGQSSEDFAWDQARLKKEAQLGFTHGVVTESHDATLASAVWYPLTGQGLIVVPLYSLLLTASAFIPFLIVQMFVQFILGAYIGLLFLETANFTLERIPGGPRLPGFTWQNLSVGMMALVAILIAGLPHFVGVLIMRQTEEVSLELLAVLPAIGLAYVPMAFLAIADLENERALNPILVFRGIGRMAAAYFPLVLIAGAVYLGTMLALLQSDAPRLVRSLAGSVVLVYSVTALMRAVSITYRRKGISLK